MEITIHQDRRETFLQVRINIVSLTYCSQSQKLSDFNVLRNYTQCIDMNGRLTDGPTDVSPTCCSQSQKPGVHSRIIRRKSDRHGGCCTDHWIGREMRILAESQ